MSSYRMKYKIGSTQYHIPVVDDMAGFGSGIPLGTILPYSANTLNPPEGFLFCDGSAISRTMYPDLFALIGTLYGEGDGVSTFNLPDLTGGKFLEGTGSAGTSKDAGLPNIEGATGLILTGGYYSAYTTDAALSYEEIMGSSVGGGGSSWKWGTVKFDASDSNAIYGASDTVQPKSLTVRYIIKAFSATTSNSELIDITQYASALNQKLTENDIYGNNFTIVYPNNGTAANPADVTINSSYVVSNPFPGYIVRCQPELYYDSKWGVPMFAQYVANGGNDYASGVTANQHDDDNIEIVTGSIYLLESSVYRNSIQGYTWNTVSASQKTLPCRIKVWKIGKIPTQST